MRELLATLVPAALIELAYGFVEAGIAVITWNYLAPEFGLPTLTYWNGLLVLALARILTGSYRRAE